MGESTREVLALLLAGTFLVAGVAKLADLAGAARAIQSFGAPGRMARPLAALVSLTEIVIAAALLPPATARVAAGVAAAILVAFAIAVAVTRLRGRTPDCHCFGRLHSSPAGWGIVARNVALAALAAALAASQPTSAPSWQSLGVLVVLAQAGLWAVLLRRYGRALVRIDELEGPTSSASLDVGSLAPELKALTVDGRETSLRDLLSLGRRVLVVFLHSECQPCRELLPRLAAWEADETVTIAVVAAGERATIAALAEGQGLRHVLVRDDLEIMDRYGVAATPSAVLVGSDGRLASAVVTGAGEVEDLGESVRADGASSDGSSHPTRIAVPAVAGALVATSAAHAGTAEPAAAPGTPTLTSTLETLHLQLGRVAKRLNQALSNLQPPVRPAGAAAPTVAQWAATGRSLVAGAEATIRGERRRPATQHVLAYLSALHAGFAAFERAGTAKDLRVAANHAQKGAEHFGKASRRFPALDRALGCPFGCTPVKGANP